MMNSQPRCARGMTLVELALTLAVLILLFAITVPSLGSRFQRVKREAAATDLCHHLRQTRLNAVDQARSWTFIISPSDKTYTAYPTQDPQERHSWALPDGMRFVANNPKSPKSVVGAPLYFYSDGSCTTREIVLRDSQGEESRIQVSRYQGVKRDVN